VQARDLGTISAFDPVSGGTLLIFAFEAVVIGGLGSLRGALAGGIGSASTSNWSANGTRSRPRRAR
jgi:branched-subunit amino acid ABC-type transport system permease component